MSTITGMELENVNTHVHTKLDFGNGVIVLLGENGVGKSTILRMIGHVLFDYISTSQGEFVSKLVNGKSGSVRVWLKGRDGTEYIVERNVGGATKYLVQRMPGYKRIEDLKNKESILKWLKDLFGMDPDYDLSTIFQHAVGVDQGAFTAPFLFTPAERKAIFNPILKLDVYDTLVDKFLEINKICEQKHTRLEVEIGKIKVKVEDKKALTERKANLTAQLAQARQRLAIISKNVKDAKVAIEGLKKLKVDIEKLERELNSLEKNIIQSESQLQENQNLIQAATAAKVLCEKAEPGYKKYISLKDAENAALENVHALAKANERKGKEQTILAKIQAEIEQTRQSLLEITERMKDLPMLKAKKEEYSSHEKVAAKLQEQAGEIIAAKQAYKEGEKVVSNLENTIKHLGARLKDKPKYEASTSRLAGLRAEESKLQKEIGKIGATLAEYDRSKTKSEGGQCPFLHETCKNIKGESLETHFQSLIDSLTPVLVELEYALNSTKIAISAAEQDEKQLKALEAEGARKEELDLQLKALRVQMEKQKASISSEQGIRAQIEAETIAMAALQPSITQMGVVETMVKQLPGLERKRVDLEDRKGTPEASIKILEVKIQGLGDAPGKLESIRGQLRTLQIDYDSYQNNIKQSSQLQLLETSYARITSMIGTLKNDEGTLKQKIEKTKQGFDPKKLAFLEDDYNNQTKVQGMLEGEINKGNETLFEVISRLEEIQKNEERAKKLEKELSITKEVWDFGEKIRNWYKLAGPKLADVLLAQINISASRIFRTLCGDTNTDLRWTNDFEVQVCTPNDKSLRSFKQLSGGEQMMAAIAVRLSLLQRLSNIKIAFFDEPTGNLDANKKRNLANVLGNIHGFNQLFVISHDSTFEGMANQVIKLAKDIDGRTKIV